MRRAYADLDSSVQQGGYNSARHFSLCELKTVSNNPAEAAVQIVRYAAVFVMSVRSYRKTPTAKRWPILLAEHISLRVLAPRTWYAGGAPRELERELSQGLADLSHLVGRPLVMDFAFEALPTGIDHRSTDGGLQAALQQLKLAGVDER